jgi:hypothetical protein
MSASLASNVGKFSNYFVRISALATLWTSHFGFNALTGDKEQLVI